MQPSIQFLLHIPEAPSEGGNFSTARRWIEMLKTLGHQAKICDSEADPRSDAVNIFFNAHKSADKIKRHVELKLNDSGKIVSVISGPDQDDSKSPNSETQFAIRSSDVVIVYEKSALDLLPNDAHQKAVLIPHSCKPIESGAVSLGDGIHVVSVSHMRPRKNLLNYFECIKQHFSDRESVRFHHIGGVHDPAYVKAVHSIAEQIPNLSLHGPLSRVETIEIIAAADLVVHPSTLEGYPNVVAEAITNSTPVLLSRIPAHTTNLEKWQPDFDSFFDTDCGNELTDLLTRFLEDSEFRSNLKATCDLIKPYFSAEHELAGLKRFLEKISDA